MAQFIDGFNVGFRSYNSAQQLKLDQEDREMRRQRQEREMALLDEQVASARRQGRTAQQLEEENAGIRSYINNGTMTSNGSGFSDESAGMMYGRGGTQSVDAAASYGNLEARRLGLDMPYTTGATKGQAYDPANPEAQAGLNRRLMSAAAVKGDHAALQSLQEKAQIHAETQTFNKAVQQFSMNPDSFGEYMRWVNKSNPMITAAPAKDPRTGQLTGYNIMTVGPSGDAAYKFISPQQAATLAGATALMQVNPTKALQLIGTVDANLATSIQHMNTAQQQATTTNNTATHNANTDATNRMNADSHRITANAASTRAAKDKQTPSQQAQEKIDMYTEILMKEDPNLTRPQAEKRAAGIILRDPNAKEQDVGLSEAGIFRKGGKYYQMGKGGKPEEVKFPGESKLDKALQDYTSGKGGAGKQDGPTDRQFYNTPKADLQRIARKPRGVSSAEAAEAQAELDRRSSESRLGAY